MQEEFIYSFTLYSNGVVNHWCFTDIESCGDSKTAKCSAWKIIIIHSSSADKFNMDYNICVTAYFFQTTEHNINTDSIGACIALPPSFMHWLNDCMWLHYEKENVTDHKLCDPLGFSLIHTSYACIFVWIWIIFIFYTHVLLMVILPRPCWDSKWTEWFHEIPVVCKTLYLYNISYLGIEQKCVIYPLTSAHFMFYTAH